MPSGPGIVTRIEPGPLDVPAAIAAASTDEAGAVGVFVGTVRSTAAVADHAADDVVRLDYDVHVGLAERRLAEIAGEATSKWDLLRVVAIHRSGVCELGEATVVVACSAPHRAEALDACRWVIDEIKATVPIFKREVYEDGSSWVGAEAGA
jgi:molybdopterin synthase catalytic subunit